MTFTKESEEFAHSVGLLVRKIRSDAPVELRDFTWTQKNVLKRLEETQATAADLARAESVKPQSMAAAIASLESLGLVERRAHPTDGRQMMVRLTLKGKALRKATREAKHGWLSQAIAKLDKQDQATLFRAGQIIKELVES